MMGHSEIIMFAAIILADLIAGGAGLLIMRRILK